MMVQYGKVVPKAEEHLLNMLEVLVISSKSALPRFQAADFQGLALAKKH